MNKFIISILFLLVWSNSCFSQTKPEIDVLLNKISTIKKSKKIIYTKQARRIVSFDKKVLKMLAHFFTDNTETSVWSSCQEKYLTKGEIAIILADYYEMMPYYPLTGMSNCILHFCEDSPNLVEIYLNAIDRDNVKKFQQNI